MNNKSNGKCRTKPNRVRLTAAFWLFTCCAWLAIPANSLSQSPTQLIYTVDDFSTNGVGPENPAGDDYYAAGAYPYDQDDNIAKVWGGWLGNGGPGAGAPTITFDPNVNVSGNTNSHGAMALAMTWDAATDGYQQFVLGHGLAQITYVPVVAGGTVGIGYPQYTNLECDVMFDASSAGTTNANGVLGVIRLGIRGVNSFGLAWQPAASYTTISDTNWHHLNMQLTAGNPDYGNIADTLIGEDVTAYVGGGGLTGNQILYVDNIRFTGPLTLPPVPPPTLALQQAKPGLRIFAGSSVNTYDRELLYTVDQKQSWVDPGATFPVSYSCLLLDPINPNIGQTMVELIGGGTTPTSYGEYADYSGPTTLWLQLNPGPAAGQVVAQVQWKTNNPGSNPGNPANPYGQALAFTNSTAVGTWSLVFTGPNTGYVGAPGQVILGPTNFTIADGTVTSDFADPVFAAFGLEPNSTAGEGAYEDWGMIKVTGVVDGTEFEDFTNEGGGINPTPGLTPSGFFNNGMSALPSGMIIVRTNDAWWLNWTQPATNFTLASATNLTSTNWINPAYYSCYSDCTPPRVYPLPQPFGPKFWVLLPYDDLPTANGDPGGTPAPTAFFRLVPTNNIVSPPCVIGPIPL